jgi:GT2 family glycosyltransferase
MANSISVVMPVFNQWHLTERCLNSLIENSSITRECLVVDNASSDETPLNLKQWKEKFESRGWIFQILTQEKNLGFGRACNLGVKNSHGNKIAILNNDTWLMPHWDTVLDRRQDELGLDMIGPFYDEKPWDFNRVQRDSQRFIARNPNKVRRKWVSILMLFRRETFLSLGGFDERFFVTYEDADLKERMERSGASYGQIGDCWIWHFSKGTRESGQLPSGYEQEGLRLFIGKWGFDPRLKEARFGSRLQRKWWKFKTDRFRF